MSTPSYMSLVSGVVTRLKEDNRMDVIADSDIYFGVEPNIPVFPAITVELQEAEDVWKTFPNNKDIAARLLVTVMERNMLGYANGLKSIEHYVRIIDDVFHTDRTISGVCYNSEANTRRFGPGVINDIPVFVCEMELNTISRYNSRN